MDDARLINLDLNADLAERLSHKRGEREKRERALAKLQTELADLQFEHMAALEHEKGGLDELVTAESVYDAQEQSLAYEEYYADVLAHMEARLKAKKHHFQNRIHYARSSIIIAIEDLRVYTEKMAIAQAA